MMLPPKTDSVFSNHETEISKALPGRNQPNQMSMMGFIRLR
jgi:hypothetical protein